MSFVSDLRAVLRGRDFRRLFATRLVSQFSDGVFQFAVAGYAFFTPEKQTTAAEAAVAMAVLFLPYSILGPFAGVFIDRWSRRQILVIAPIVRGTLLGVAAVLVAAKAPDWCFYTAALAVLGVNRFFLSALSASLPHVVDSERLLVANAVTPTSGTVVTFIGAGAGYLLRLAFGAGQGGTALLLVSSGLIFGMSAFIAATMARSLLGPSFDPSLPQAREALRNVITGLVDGVRHIVHMRAPAAALGSMAAHRFFYGMTFVMTVMLYRFYFTTDAEAGLSHLTGVLATSGIGFFMAAVITPWATERFRPESWIPIMLATAGVLGLVLCLPFRQLGFLVAGFVLGVAGQSVKICTDTIVQRDVEDAYLGRVFAIYDMLFNGVFVIAAGVAALMLPANGKSYPVLVVAAIGYLLSALAYRLITAPRTRTAQEVPQ
ncbi:MFS transporter [Sphaerisporangium krabiense]|uniref:MFS family permease n=1 Tax=Sphaerisporangium krabiense TaxID=763782 RepID=A0A7W8Z3D8_9ACTN|nr:MFS transporter [Sphaerisporangium krabiense]MBB5626413.1 MFS family permease [Sphaerisporangium krabiense]GII63332.1 MFS transporter [Sphaerisporangium krabiense]